ncbi:tryptophan halogenase family protein [Maricaulis sp.]|uniref:tryptophan halogenase family protein n=1 Tax=Maricaulis sp. TaxID=1486257 RepID=UPI0025BD8AEB|nr:tryptophan halogenase family protein [Maricaulis sp.]
MSDNSVRRVLIVGGGTAGWMCAAALSNAFRDTDMAVELAETEAIGTVGVGEATRPHIRHFNAGLGIDEADFIRETRATFKLAIEFCNWNRIGDSYLHPLGEYGMPAAEIEFHHLWASFVEDLNASALDAYSLPIQMARANRFAPPHTDPNSLLSIYSYAYQFDAGRYARYLRTYAEARGVTRTEGRIQSVARNGANGHIASVRLEDGRVLAADFFVDCSGFSGLLIEKTLKAGCEDWTDWLPCDQALAVPCEGSKEITPYTRATAREAGWQWRIPLQHRIGNGYVYSSNHISDDEAAATLLANLDGKPLADPRCLRFVTDRRKQAWVKNCVALGLSSGFLEPLESTSIHLIQSGIAKLLQMFPSTAFEQADIDRFKARTKEEFERVRDFIILHYNATTRDDTPFWDHCRTMPVPPGLAEKYRIFEGYGRIFRENDESVNDTSWFAVMIGQGLRPRAFDPVAECLSEDETRRRLAQIRQAMQASSDHMPTHADFIANNCAAEMEPLS